LIDPNKPVKYFARLGWVKAVDASKPLKEAAQIMVENRIRHLPVTSAGKLIGFISIKDVIEVLDSYNAPELLKDEVSKFMSRKVIATHPEDPIWEVLKAMAEADVGAVPLLNDEGEIVGIFTERDVVTNVAPELDWGDKEVDDVATPKPKVVEPGTPLGDAIDLMNELKVRHLPVVESAKNRGPAKGLVTALGLVDYVIKNIKRLSKDLKADPVSSVMEEFYYVAKGKKFSEALQTLARSTNDAILVLGEDKVVEGILTDRDVMIESARYVERLAMP
jgi:CBS domain-containing protein